jgi:predicted component of type VI protein secretion system
MPLDLHISGPGLDVHRRLAPGESALILGRDSDCSVCLPDPERNVSRRHLSVWNDGEQLQFHVLSVVNGVTTSEGELPPGARGVLASGDALYLSAFRLLVTHVTEQAATPLSEDPSADPWEQFARHAAQLRGDEDASQAAPATEEDPFGDWGFQSTFGPGSPGGELSGDKLLPANDLEAFFAGLGMGGQVSLTRGEMESIGRVTRIALQGLLQASQAANATRKHTRAEDRTMAEPREMNALRLDTPLDTKLQYLFGGQVAAAGFMPPDRAVTQLVGELTVHQQAMGEALREVLQKVLEDFDPEALKKRLLGGGPRIFESARAWEAFARDYAERAGAEPGWVQQVLDRHFASAYARALVRAKRNTPGRAAGG